MVQMAAIFASPTSHVTYLFSSSQLTECRLKWLQMNFKNKKSKQADKNKNHHLKPT